jgi:hypothetical protein
MPPRVRRKLRQAPPLLNRTRCSYHRTRRLLLSAVREGSNYSTHFNTLLLKVH